jgi:MraZ protein
MLIGNSPARIDDKGRLKIPTKYRKPLEEQYGREFFVTSVNGRFVQIFPLPVWAARVDKLSRISPFHPVAERYLDAVNFHGAVATMDRQGRILIQPLLRKKAGMNGEVSVLGKNDHLVIWNQERIEKDLVEKEVTDDDLRELSTLT